MRRLLLAWGVLLLALLALPAASQAACPDTKPSYTSACGPLFTLPQWADSAGWDQPGSYETIQLADLDGKPGDELLGRSPVGVWVERFDAAAGQWALAGTSDGGVALALPDHEGWNEPSSSKTMQTADLDGDGAAELLVRGDDGVRTYRWSDGAATFASVGAAPLPFPETDSRREPGYYETIQTADIDGDHKAELLGRTADGLHTYRWNPASGHYEEAGPTFTEMADFPGEWYWPGYYQTIQTADVDGDGRAELLARHDDGLHTWRWGDDGWAPVGAALADLQDPAWDQPQYWLTIQTADLDGDGSAELLARGPAGLQTWRWADGWQAAGAPLATLSDAQGWDKPDRYLGIRTGDLDGAGGAELLARDAAGIVVWRRAGDAWSQLSSGVPALADDPWNQARHYATLQTGDPDGDGHADLLGRGVFGMRTFAWDEPGKRFDRPRAYGAFPAFAPGPDQDAYAALGRYLLGRDADFRAATYAGPSETISEATLDRYRGQLSERCDPVALAGAAPPRYANCTPPPGSTVDPDAWTAVTNQITAELWGAAGVVAHFGALDTIQTKLFQDQQGSLPALDAALKLPPDVPDRAPTFIKLVKAGLEIVGDIAQLTPAGDQYKKAIRAIALTAHALGAVGDALGLKPAPDPPQSYAKITDEVARMQQRQRDITEAQRRYVLADYGLLTTVGSLVNGRLLTLDTTAMLSAGRQGFASWAYQLYTPAYWKRYLVRACASQPPLVSCDPPSGPNVRHTTPASFTAILNNQSGCSIIILYLECTWVPAGEIGDRLWGDVSEECTYDPTPGSTAAWRYGCNLGVDPALLLDQKEGWGYTTTDCRLDRHADLSICKDVAAATLDRANATVDDDGDAHVRLVGTVRHPGGVASVRLERLLFEEDGAGELVEDAGAVDVAPVALGRRPGRSVYAAPRRPREPRVTVRVARRGPHALRVVLEARGARLADPQACADGARTVRLETRVAIDPGPGPAGVVPDAGHLVVPARRARPAPARPARRRWSDVTVGGPGTAD